MNKKIVQFFKNEWFLLLAIIISFAGGWYFNPKLPEILPIHWNLAGEVDGYGPKMLVTSGFPAIALGIYVLMLVIPFIDPKRKNYSLFEGSYKIIRSLTVLFFIFMYAILILAGLGYNLPIDKIVVIAVAILFIVMGNYMGRVKQNFFVGIKTPWTLNDNEIWNKTHRASGKLWVLSGLVMMVTIFFNGMLTFGIIMLTAFFPIVYSYILFVKKGSKT